jgi:hypothetical protein
MTTGSAVRRLMLASAVLVVVGTANAEDMGAQMTPHLKEDAEKLPDYGALRSAQTGGCVIQRTYLLSNKTEFADSHCVNGRDKCNSLPNGYCFDYGIIDPTILSKSCTPVSRCPPMQ